MKLVLFLTIVACGPSLAGRPTEIDLAQYSAATGACITQNDSRETIDACRRNKRREFCAKFPHERNCYEYLDAGTVTE